MHIFFQLSIAFLISVAFCFWSVQCYKFGQLSIVYLFSRVLCTCLISTSCVFYQYYYYVFDQLSIPCLISWVLCIPSAECYVFHLQSICSGEYCVFYQMSIVYFISRELCIWSAEYCVFDQLSIVCLFSWVCPHPENHPIREEKGLKVKEIVSQSKRSSGAKRPL